MIAADEERKARRRNSGNNYFIILQSFPWNISVRRKETFPRSSIVGAPCPGLGGIRGTLRNWFDGSGGFGHGSVSPAPEQTIGKRSINGGSHRHEFQPCNPASDSEIHGHPGFKTQSTRGGWKNSPAGIQPRQTINQALSGRCEAQSPSWEFSRRAFLFPPVCRRARTKARCDGVRPIPSGWGYEAASPLRDYPVDGVKSSTNARTRRQAARQAFEMPNRFESGHLTSSPHAGRRKPPFFVGFAVLACGFLVRAVWNSARRPS